MLDLRPTITITSATTTTTVVEINVISTTVVASSSGEITKINVEVMVVHVAVPITT